MLNLFIALAAGLVVTLLIKVAGFSILAGIVPGTLAFIGCYIFLARRMILKHPTFGGTGLKWVLGRAAVAVRKTLAF